MTDITFSDNSFQFEYNGSTIILTYSYIAYISVKEAESGLKSLTMGLGNGHALTIETTQESCQSLQLRIGMPASV